MACCTVWQRGIRRHFDGVMYNTSVVNGGTSVGRKNIISEATNKRGCSFPFQPWPLYIL
jgi:hypothetical protein